MCLWFDTEFEATAYGFSLLLLFSGLSGFFPLTYQKPKSIFHLLRFSLLCSLLNNRSNCARLNLLRFQPSKANCPKGPANGSNILLQHHPTLLNPACCARSPTLLHDVERSLISKKTHHLQRHPTILSFSDVNNNVTFVWPGPDTAKKTPIHVFKQQFQPTLSVLVFNMIFQIKLYKSWNRIQANF